MEFITEESRMAPVMMDTDVVVAGGGPSGLCAALASVLTGARTVLVERYGFLGGNLAGLNLEASMTFHDRTGRKIIDGVPQWLVDTLIAEGGSPGHVPDLMGYCQTITPVDPEILKYVALKLTTEAGVELYLHSWVYGPIIEGNMVKGIFIQSKSGRSVIKAKVIVDATGDADVAVAAGAPFKKGSITGGYQPMSLMPRLGGVNIERVLDYVYSHPDEFRPLNYSRNELLSKPFIHLWGWSGFLTRGYQRGELSFERREMLLITTSRPGEVIVNLCRSFGDGTNVRDLTKAELETRKQLMEFLRFARRELPGFENSYLISTGAYVGVRETRRIVGEYELTEEDVVSGAHFYDAVAKSAFPIDIHQSDGPGMITIPVQVAYDVPYRCLVPLQIEGILVTGRCISATHEAIASTRLTATCMALGQAAGVAAALACQEGCTPREVPITKLQDTLRKQGAIID